MDKASNVVGKSFLTLLQDFNDLQSEHNFQLGLCNPMQDSLFFSIKEDDDYLIYCLSLSYKLLAARLHQLFPNQINELVHIYNSLPWYNNNLAASIPLWKYIIFVYCTLR